MAKPEIRTIMIYSFLSSMHQPLSEIDKLRRSPFDITSLWKEGMDRTSSSSFSSISEETIFPEMIVPGGLKGRSHLNSESLNTFTELTLTLTL